MKVKDKKDNQTDLDESLLHSAVELLKNGGCQLKALHLNLTSYCPGIRRKHVYKIISSNPEIFIFNSVIEGSGATLVKKDTIITLNPDYSTNQVQNKDPTADLSEDLFTIATIICVLRQEMPCSLKILHLNLSEYNLEINKKKLLSILNGSHQIFTILYDVSSTSRSNPVVSLNQETYILLSKQPNKDTSKDPLFWSSVLDILKCKQPCGLKILQRQLTTNYPDIDNRLLLNMLREYPDRFTLQFGNDSNPWIALNSEMSEVPKQELAANVAPGSYAAEGMPANVKICLVPDQRKKQEKLSIAPIKANESGGNFNKTKKPRKQKKKKLNIEPKKDKEERIQQPKGTMKIFPSTQEISRSMNKKDGQKKRMDLLRHKQEARENGHSGKQMKPEIKVHSKFGLREFS